MRMWEEGRIAPGQEMGCLEAHTHTGRQISSMQPR